MRIPPSFALAYLPESKVAEELFRFAGSRLQSQVCQPNSWLFDHRVKSDESVLAKLELGSVARLADVHDIYAATVVVPTLREIPDAVGAVKAAFPDSEEKLRRRGKAETFEYDDVHVIAQLGDTAAGLNEGLRARKFEIQIRTGLQFAWWRATHDVVYKGDQKSWRVQRLASQARASLELLDAVLADLRGAATILSDIEDDDDPEFRSAVELLDLWSAHRRPTNLSRFVVAVMQLSKSAGVELAGVQQLLSSDAAAPFIADERITPFQAVFAALAEHVGPTVLADALPEGTRVLVTDELVQMAPHLETIDVGRRVELT